MAQARLSMRKIREVLRLRADGFSEREIARSVGCARSSVQICLWRADKAGVSWPLSPDQDRRRWKRCCIRAGHPGWRCIRHRILNGLSEN